VAAALWLAVTLSLTLLPVDQVTPVPFWAWWAERQAGLDVVQNIVLFLPMGWILHRAGWSAWRIVLAGALLSGGIEFSQQWISGRTSTAMDITSNTIGAALGWWMATPVVRPRMRVALSAAALSAFLGLHVLNTEWPAEPVRADDGGARTGMFTHGCDATAPASAICLTIPVRPGARDLFILVVGPDDRTFARVQSNLNGRPLGPDDCVTESFESTYGALLRFRPPISRACALVAGRDSTIEVRIDPRLEHAVRGTWEPTRAGVWMWPVWPFDVYHPGLLRAVGALTFVIGTALLAGVAYWWLPVAYLALLEAVALLCAMSGPGLWELGWAAMGWVVATGAVALDAWWRSSPARRRS
jgi:hypothetical protein